MLYRYNTVYRQKTPLELCSQAAWLFHLVSPRISEKPDEKKTTQKVIVGGRALPCLVRVHVFLIESDWQLLIGLETGFLIDVTLSPECWTVGSHNHTIWVLCGQSLWAVFWGQGLTDRLPNHCLICIVEAIKAYYVQLGVLHVWRVRISIGLGVI